MSIDVLFDLQLEVRRLFIAGSTVAAGDVRLKKMLPQLQKLGEAAPVFQRVAQAVQQVVEPPAGGEPSLAAGKLLELGTLLSSILYTQGKTEAAAARTQVTGTDTTLNTRIPYRKIKPVLEALTTKGPGRLEVLNLAYEEKRLTDFRLLWPAVAALDDSYSELAEFVWRKVIPSWGAEALPALQEQLDLQGGKGDARRLQLIHDQLGASGCELYLKAVAEGAPEVKAQAVELLGHYAEHEELILQQADEKRKEVRQAAYTALARLGTSRASERLYRALLSKDRELAVDPIRLSRDADLTVKVIEHIEELAAKLNLLDAGQLKDSAHELHLALQCLDDKKDAPILPLLQRLLTDNNFLIKGTEDAQEAAAQLLLNLGLPEADQFAVTLGLEAGGKRFVSYSFRAALRTLAPNEIYDRYAGFIKNKRDAASRELLKVFYNHTEPVSSYVAEAWNRDQAEPAAAWDPRWLELFIAIDEEELVCRLAEKPDKKLNAYLVRKCKAAGAFNQYKTVTLLLTLFRLGHPDAPELLMENLEKSTARQLYYLDYAQLAVLSMLPRHYAEGLERFAEKLQYDSVKRQVLEVVETIKAKPDNASDADSKGTGWLTWIKSKMS
ncbi:HEAT repeat domain-containing protein [Paenibacillus rigui]|uniref:HEAT repeat domain-containing protein n=1 Tax=Paenibacillus rigui TaxID=554312 RepID=A0A229UJF6_9BACL|nr:HEAT repeat domain-containing protein [Paenibacillus rigui]OXM83520.1 hypothetical protein CF651_25330 [Paenibacillus rigui]